MGRSSKRPSQSSPLKSNENRAKENTQLNINKLTMKQDKLSVRSKLNAVMQMDPPGNRRRPVRTPKAATPEADSSSSPNDPDSSNEAIPGGSSSECRRSSRKKTIKFDVRDLLNKNRRSHKIQIEARIDSNAPKEGTGVVNKAELDSKQKNFIEKSAIFRRYSISENKLPPRPPPPPGALMHTIQQCVGELEQLPLDGDNLAAISPIARRLSRTQDILTASMMKPKQVSSLIVTKLESAATSSKPAPQTRGRCLAFPSTSNAVQQKPRRGRPAKNKTPIETTTESSSSDSFEKLENIEICHQSSKEEIKSDEEYVSNGREISLSPDSSTKGIDLKENLDASAVTLPQPNILTDCSLNSNDESCASAEEDSFAVEPLSSDDSTGFLRSSPNVDQISLFGRSDSTETSCSDDSEKRRKKIRVSVKRVSLTSLKSPSKSNSCDEKSETIEIFSSNDDSYSSREAFEDSNHPSTTDKTQSSRTSNQIEPCSSTPPILVLDGEVSNSTTVGSVVEVSSCSVTPIKEISEVKEKSNEVTALPRARSCKRLQVSSPKNKPNAATKQSPSDEKHEENDQQQDIATNKKSSSPLSVQVPLKSPKAAQSQKTLSQPETQRHDIDNTKKCSQPEIQNEAETIHMQSHEETELNQEVFTAQQRSLRSAQSVQLPASSVSSSLKKQNKTSPAPKKSTKQFLEIPSVAETPSDETTSSALSKNQTEGCSSEKKDDPSGPTLIKTGAKTSLRLRKDIPNETNTSNPEQQQSVRKKAAANQDVLEGDKALCEKTTKVNDEPLPGEKELISQTLKKHEETYQADGENLKLSETSADKTDDIKRVFSRSATSGSVHRSSTDTSVSERRESLRHTRRTSLSPKKKLTSKKVSKVAAKSRTAPADSSSESSESPDKTRKIRKQTTNARSVDKSKDETSSVCSETFSTVSTCSTSSSSSPSSSSSASSSNSSSSSSVGSSNSSSSSSNSSSTTSSTSSSSSTTSSSSSSSGSEGRTTRSRKTQKPALEEPKIDPIEIAEPIKSVAPIKVHQKQNIDLSLTNKVSTKPINEARSSRSEKRSSTAEQDTNSESSEVFPSTSHTRSGKSRVREKVKEKSPNEQTSTNSTQVLEKETKGMVRAKSKKRTKRLAPLKDSSSESNTFSDDERTSTFASSPLTRARRKTISSASELEELTAINVYVNEFKRHKNSKGKRTQEDIPPPEEKSTVTTGKNSNKLADKKPRQTLKERKETRSSVKDQRGSKNEEKSVENEESKAVQPSPENKDTNRIPVVQEEQTSSSTPEPVAQAKALRQKKTTRLSLKMEDAAKPEEQSLSTKDSPNETLSSETEIKSTDSSSLQTGVSSIVTPKASKQRRSPRSSPEIQNEIIDKSSPASSKEQELDSHISLQTEVPPSSNKVSQPDITTQALQKDEASKSLTKTQTDLLTKEKDSLVEVQSTLDSKPKPLVEDVQVTACSENELQSTATLPFNKDPTKRSKDKTNAPHSEHPTEQQETKAVSEKVEDQVIDTTNKSADLLDTKDGASKKGDQPVVAELEENKESTDAQHASANQVEPVEEVKDDVKIPRRKKAIQSLTKSPDKSKEERDVEKQLENLDTTIETYEAPVQHSTVTDGKAIEESSKPTSENKEEVSLPSKILTPSKEILQPQELHDTPSEKQKDEESKSDLLKETQVTPDLIRPAQPTKRTRKPTRFSPRSPENVSVTVLESKIASESVTTTLQDDNNLLKAKEAAVGDTNISGNKNNLTFPDPTSSPSGFEVKEPTREQKATSFSVKITENIQITKPSESMEFDVKQFPLPKEEITKEVDVAKTDIIEATLQANEISSSPSEPPSSEKPAKTSRVRKATRFSDVNPKDEAKVPDTAKTSQQTLTQDAGESSLTSPAVNTSKNIEDSVGCNKLEAVDSKVSLSDDPKTKTRSTTEIGITSCSQLTSGSTQSHIDEEKKNFEASPSSKLKNGIEIENKITSPQESLPKSSESTEKPESKISSKLPYPKAEVIAEKGLKKKIQSMWDSVPACKSPKADKKDEQENSSMGKKESTPRRKKKTTTVHQDPTEVNRTIKSSDDPDMKTLSIESNQSQDSTKVAEVPAKVEQKLTSRRQLDSSFIESLEKSLLRPQITKKSSKKKEKDESSLTHPSPKVNQVESKKPQELLEELKKHKKVDEITLKLKKKSKDSAKANKQFDQISPSKRKSPTKAKAPEEVKPLEPDPNSIDLITSKKSSPLTVVAHQEVVLHTPKTKGETKFFPTDQLFNQEKPIVPNIDQTAPSVKTKENSPDLLPDPLKDIEKFIEDGVNLLKRCYKIDTDDVASLDRDILKADNEITPKKCKLDESIIEEKTKSPRDDDNSNSNSNSECSTNNTSNSEVDTPNGIRRSHRIKNNSKSTKCLVGRGLVRERERFSTKDDEKTIYSIDDQKLDLAEVEAKNSKFLKEMEERLSNFRVIRENEYKCERVVSKEAKRMLCDCFLTHEEEERGELGCGEDCLNRLLMIECGMDCTVRERCTNRRFNKFLYSPCRVFRTEKKGFGIMADIEILPGEFIMEYVGEVINGDEFEIRINEYSKDKNKHYYFMALRGDAVIDATAKGNISRFINHSCDPNAETQKWTVNGELRIGFFSRKNIMPGEEITFDYQYQRYGKEAQKCYCESANCRGWIGEEPSSEEEEEYEEIEGEGESEETEEEEQKEPLVPLPVVPSEVPPLTVVVPEQTLQIVPVVAADISGVEENIRALPEAVAVPVPVPEVPKETPTAPSPKKKKEKKRLIEDKIKRREPKQFLEDPDIEDEVRFLVKCGLKNQADTLRLSRLIVRAKLLETRLKLLQILRKGELPCRRLFLDYHGLRLLHGWMSEVIDTQDTEKSMEIRMELLSVLECLPISNKTMLTDSKVYQTVRDWSNNKESHSPSDGSPKEATTTSLSPTQSTEGSAVSELQKIAAKLVSTWDNLPEIFRIPKRERIEQMKEHEREADRQYKGLNEDSRSKSEMYRNRERFMSKSDQKKGRFNFNWSRGGDKDKDRERANERRKYAQSGGNGKDDKTMGSCPGESQLSKEQRRELFAAKVARDEAEKRLTEERREFDIKCRFFGLDPKRIRSENMPFCVNPSTGQWYSTDKKPIATPPSYAHVQVPVKPKSTNPEDYRLPQMDLPPLWKFAISPKGKIYYYHVKIRIPQWEPPIKILPLAGQKNTEVKNSESDSSNTGCNDSSEDDIDIIKGLDPIKLQAYIEKKIEDRRLQRYNRLVEEKPISPRKEEDRIYNQIEVRKYKENKEKIRKRKEEIRRRADSTGKTTSLESANLSETAEGDENAADVLPIQDYLLSSEEEELKAECNNSPLIDKIVQGDKIVDELDALQRKRNLKRNLPIRDKYEHKKRKTDKGKDSSKSTKRSKDGESGSTSSSKYRKVREKFRCEIAGIIVQHLKPYRSESCFTGKITTDDDFNHLARKLTHFVMVKELKYCESIGQTLIVTESVKNKSREFIKKYMAKYGGVYVRPKNDPEFKEIPFL